MTSPALEAQAGANIEAIIALIGAQPAIKQLEFWRTFRKTHTRRIANTEAEFCPKLLQLVDTRIEQLLKEM